MGGPVLTVPVRTWDGFASRADWIAAAETGLILFFPDLAFALSDSERELLAPGLLAQGVRNISLDVQGRLKGAAGDTARQQAVAALIGRFASQALSLVRTLFPAYDQQLSPAPTSLRPMQVESRRQSVRAD